MLFIIAVVLGIILGLIMPYNLTIDTLPYVAVAIIAALDSIFGGIVALYNKRYSNFVFMTGLTSNAVLAVILTYVGNILGINLSFAAIVVFGVRIFNNLSNIRRLTIDKYFLKKVNSKLLRLEEKNEDSNENSENIGEEREMSETENADAEKEIPKEENQEKNE